MSEVVPAGEEFKLLIMEGLLSVHPSVSPVIVDGEHVRVGDGWVFRWCLWLCIGVGCSCNVNEFLLQCSPLLFSHEEPCPTCVVSARDDAWETPEVGFDGFLQSFDFLSAWMVADRAFRGSDLKGVA